MKPASTALVVASLAACMQPAAAPGPSGPPPVYLAPQGPGNAASAPAATAPGLAPARAVAPGDDAASAALFDALMRYRAANGLPPIARSASLTRVAQAHVADLEAHPPDNARCNTHSWSNGGPWTACCYTPDAAQAQCMWSKPKELTPYTGYGLEVADWTTGTMSADTAVKSWDGSGMHKPVILNQGQWAQRWNAMGAAMSPHYAVAWFGYDPDPAR